MVTKSNGYFMDYYHVICRNWNKLFGVYYVFIKIYYIMGFMMELWWDSIWNLDRIIKYILCHEKCCLSWKLLLVTKSSRKVIHVMKSNSCHEKCFSWLSHADFFCKIGFFYDNRILESLSISGDFTGFVGCLL